MRGGRENQERSAIVVTSRVHETEGENNPAPWGGLDGKNLRAVSIAKQLDLQFAVAEMSPMQPPSERDSGTNEVAPVRNVVRAERMAGEDEEDTELLKQMLEEAKNYILSFSWCETILGSYFAGGVGKVFAIFLFNISPAHPEVDSWMWIVVGDVPPAYLPLGDCRTSREVFDTYIAGMKRWVELARDGREAAPEDHVPPVNVPPTPEWAESLDGRLRSLRQLLQPFFD